VQALWDSSPNLLQLPGVTNELAKKAGEAGIETVFDLMDMEDADRNKLLNMSEVRCIPAPALFARWLRCPYLFISRNPCL